MDEGMLECVRACQLSGAMAACTLLDALPCHTSLPLSAPLVCVWRFHSNQTTHSCSLKSNAPLDNHLAKKPNLNISSNRLGIHPHSHSHSLSHPHTPTPIQAQSVSTVQGGGAATSVSTALRATAASRAWLRPRSALQPLPLPLPPTRLHQQRQPLASSRRVLHRYPRRQSRLQLTTPSTRAQVAAVLVLFPTPSSPSRVTPTRVLARRRPLWRTARSPINKNRSIISTNSSSTTNSSSSRREVDRVHFARATLSPRDRLTVQVYQPVCWARRVQEACRAVAAAA